MYQNYRGMGEAIKYRREFNTGGRVKGFKDGEDYIVYSYSTEILRVNKDGDVLNFNTQRYSNTTSKLQRIIAHMMNVDLKVLRMPDCACMATKPRKNIRAWIA